MIPVVLLLLLAGASHPAMTQQQSEDEQPAASSGEQSAEPEGEGGSGGLFGAIPEVAGGPSTGLVGGVESAPRGEQTYEGGELVIAPIPISNPTVGTGVVGLAGYIYRLDKDDAVSPPTMTGVAAGATSNKTWVVAAMHEMAFHQDRFRAKLLGGVGNINYDFTTPGLEPGSTIRIPLNVRGVFLDTGFLIRTFERVFVGPRYKLIKTETRLRFDIPDEPPDVADFTLDVRTSAIGFRVLRDTRDSSFYPRKGELAEFQGDFFRDGFGSDFDYETYKTSFNLYRGIGQRHVIAGRATACAATGGVPFFDLCYLGLRSDLAGYRVGERQGEALFATQAEYRVKLFWRFGAVGFFGVGQVGPSFGDFKGEDWLPGGGAGIRFLVAKEHNVNMSVDFAWGEGSSAIYIKLGEAF